MTNGESHDRKHLDWSSVIGMVSQAPTIDVSDLISVVAVAGLLLHGLELALALAGPGKLCLL